MTLTFWALYLPALAILLGLGLLAGVVEARVRSAIRRWRVQRALRQMLRDRTLNQPAKRFAQHLLNCTLTPTERHRVELDGLATARDKAERKIT